MILEGSLLSVNYSKQSSKNDSTVSIVSVANISSVFILLLWVGIEKIDWIESELVFHLVLIIITILAIIIDYRIDNK